MQTFLPFPSFHASAAVLDVRRLGKQRVEAVQVLRGLVVPGYGWRRHPAVQTRGVVFGGRPRTQEQLAADGDRPPWLGAPDLHRSHQSALVRKAPAFYRERFPGVPDDLPYVWPRSDRDTDGVA
ncbi:cytoplasmic protein [Streptomyces goshikiensis]|uniref:Cytoplasmic protein n=1 Tax=Streptomyces goshikiensis TaxID=1942 RepID=A0ABZ1RXK5_9ACTN|nr:pyrimidine dimer DNA glycosylase/endonuclease V [Streptomyces goshikiensis]